ncbi:hypothetical protein [Poseidonibacter antarcticus]|uniref:hypothetical protein n=1 Tax=Poseidonibacter antarcticus TaxID=2478538 RepID=UPI000EF45BF7|nr:hypothetical protein [Poseidonibacter antarcticus]
MKKINLNNKFVFWMIFLMVVLILSFIRNYSYYNSKKISDSIEIKLLTKNLSLGLKKCLDNHTDNILCIEEIKKDLNYIKPDGIVKVIKDNELLINYNKTKPRHQNRELVIIPEYLRTLKEYDYNFYVAKHSTPNIPMSVFRSITFSITDIIKHIEESNIDETFDWYISNQIYMRSQGSLIFMLLVYFALIYVRKLQPNLKKEKNIFLSNNPQSLVKILTNFTEDKPMKFTTHDWDFGELSKSDYKNFDGYMAEVKTQWLAIKDDLKTLSPNLYKEVYNFLWETDSTEALGWSSMDGLKNWCNAGNKPFDFKDFKEIVNVFKRKIEIRKDTMLEDIFIQERKKLGRKYKVELIKLKGVTFYTDTEKLINVIKTIFSQMHEVERHEYTNIIVEVLGDSTKEFIELKIMQLGAQAGSDAYVMLEEVQNGDFAGIKENLNNLCDWSIESSYEDKNYRVNYLTSNTSQNIEELNYKPNGFTHILRFYNK